MRRKCSERERKRVFVVTWVHPNAPSTLACWPLLPLQLIFACCWASATQSGHLGGPFDTPIDLCYHTHLSQHSDYAPQRGKPPSRTGTQQAHEAVARNARTRILDCQRGGPWRNGGAAAFPQLSGTRTIIVCNLFSLSRSLRHAIATGKTSPSPTILPMRIQ